MSLYTTPLQFGYFLALLFAAILWLRGWREERRSDTLLGWVLFFLAMEIQDYTFGFAGINVLWEELNGFPRYTSLLFAPTVYFYLKSYTNRQFHYQQKDILHLLPWAIYFLFNLIIFLQGKYVVQQWQSSSWGNATDWLLTTSMLSSYAYYFGLSLRTYNKYRSWTETQFSDTEAVNLIWYRNFLYLMIFSIAFKWIWFSIDFALDLDFYQDWWWNLATVGIIIYVAIAGYQQRQPIQMAFAEKTTATESSRRPLPEDDLHTWKIKLLEWMQQEKPYLESELTLSDLARQLHITSSLLSQIINVGFNKNFNDFVNAYRIEAFKIRLQKSDYQHLTLLGIALECGFNSKATFNRAFKKHTGQSPSEYTNSLYMNIS